MNEIKRDCYAWNERRHLCEVLEDIVCKRKKCSFYTQKEEHQLKQAQAELDKLEKARAKAMEQVAKKDGNIYKF